MTSPEDRAARGLVARDLNDNLDELASRLWDMPDRPQDDIPEQVLARELIATLTDGNRDSALWFFCHERAWRAAPPDFMLDECADSTYAASGAIAVILHDVIVQQDRADQAMTMIAAEEIRRRYEHERGMKELGLTS